ncbi:UdgX family uracil-DNA binding protein, partial [Cellulosimicrobium funkei]|uniref:UdgX family uracil-DNA binding protein n=1 Tax=Cellulosimicrobium funkei TaxID=264251 RepID=UPI003757BFED
MSPRPPERPGAQEWLPRGRAVHDVEALDRAAHDCHGCELWADATQVVFSRGPHDARLALVGEQPGDHEDREGESFVGPAGRLLDDALDAAGLAADDVYLTNAVKHFRFEQRGGRRLHKSPDVAHVRACLPGLTAEVAAVGPRIVVAMGATAGRAVLGRPVRVTAERGRVLDLGDAEPASPFSPGAPGGGGRSEPSDGARLPRPTDAPRVVLTTHPSALLRVRDCAEREAAFAALVDDLVGGLEERDVPPRATRALAALEAPLTSGVESLVHETATRLVESDAFEGAWLQANRVAHQQLVAVMRGEDGDVLQVSDDGRLSIQLSGLIDLLKERLVDRGLDVAARIPSVDATFTVAQSAELVTLQNRYAQVVTLTTWLPWVVLGLLAAGVLVANHRSRALVVAGLALTGAMVALGVGLAVARGLYLGALSGQVVRLDAAEVVFDQAVGYLRLTLRTVGVLGLVVALAAYVGGPSASARSLRAGLGR